MIGDIIGKPGRQAVEQLLPDLRQERGIDFVTANGENVAGGMGLTVSTAEALFAAGVDVITSGNHIWDKREIYPYLERTERVLRPLNYGTADVPGRGWGTYHALDGTELAVINLQGRTYMQPIENPFTDADRLLDEASEPLPPVRLVDFHCEMTSEKNALGLYLDGRVSVVVGTHTHIVTGDERILPNGTAYLTDLGMTGPVYSVIGFDPATRPAAVHQRPADPLRGRQRPRRLQRLPDRRRPGDGTGPRDRADPADRRSVAACRSATPRSARHSRRQAHRPSTSTATRHAPTASSSRPSSRPPPPPPASGPVDHRPRHPGRVPRAHPRRLGATDARAHPGRRDQRRGARSRGVVRGRAPRHRSRRRPGR